MKKTKNISRKRNKEDRCQDIITEAKKVWRISPSNNIGNFFISCRKGLLLSQTVK